MRPEKKTARRRTRNRNPTVTAKHIQRQNRTASKGASGERGHRSAMIAAVIPNPATPIQNCSLERMTVPRLVGSSDFFVQLGEVLNGGCDARVFARKGIAPDAQALVEQLFRR